MTVWEIVMGFLFFTNLGSDIHITLQIVGAIGGMFGGMLWFASLAFMLTCLFNKPEDSIENELRACTKTSGGQAT